MWPLGCIAGFFSRHSCFFASGCEESDATDFGILHIPNPGSVRLVNSSDQNTHTPFPTATRDWCAGHRAGADIRLLLTPKQAAAALAVSERTLWQLCKDGELRCVRIGRAVRYDLGELQSWIARKLEHEESAKSAGALALPAYT